MNASIRLTKIGEIARLVDRSTSATDLPVYSISKHRGFVRSDEYFNKKVHSEDTSSYRSVAPGDFAFSPIHLDEGSIALAVQAGLISPMYRVFEVDAEACDRDYIIRILKSPPMVARYNALGDGSVHRRRSVPFERLAQLEIPLPPLEEQRRIASILNKADKLRHKRKRALGLLDNLTQSVFLDMFGDPVGSTHHKMEVMGDVIRGIESGWSPTCLDRAAVDDEAGVLKLSAVTNSEFIPEQNKALPPGLKPKAGTEVVAGDILFCRKNTRELIGSSVYVWNTRPNIHMSDLIFRLVPEKSKIDPIFLQAQLSLPSLRHKISEMSGGAAGSMPNVSKARLRDLEVIVPRLKTQMEFAGVVRGHYALRKSHVQSQAQIDLLFSSLQTRAFSGQL